MVIENFTEEFMEKVENRFKKFMVLSITNIKIDYIRKTLNTTSKEILQSDLYYPNINILEYCNIMDSINDENLFECLYSLTSRQKEILFLLIIHKYTKAEVSNMLSITQQCVNATKRRVLILLKRKLNNIRGTVK